MWDFRFLIYQQYNNLLLFYYKQIEKKNEIIQKTKQKKTCRIRSDTKSTSN